MSYPPPPPEQPIPPPPVYPYASAGHGYAAQYPIERPGVCTWFNVYAVIMALLYFSLLAFGVTIFVVGPAQFADAQTPAEEWVILGIIFTILGLVLGAPFAIAPFLPRKPWVWIYDLVLICLGLTSACTWPLTIPMLIFWIKTETKLWFGRNP